MWRRNPVGDVSIMSRTLLEKERKRYYLVLVSRNWFSCGFVEGKSSRRAKDYQALNTHKLSKIIEPNAKVQDASDYSAIAIAAAIAPA